MNLRARNLGLIIISALTLFSCEEEISTIGLPPENNLGIFFADIPMGDKASQVWIDKINSRGTGVILAGSYNDPDLGQIEAKNFSEVLLTPRIGFDTLLADASFDSLVYSLRVSGVSGTDFENQPQSFDLFQLQEPIEILSADSTSLLPFYTSSSQELSGKVGEGVVEIFPDSIGLTFQQSGFDSTALDTRFDNESIYIYNHRLRLNDAFGIGFFNTARSSGPEFSDGNKFAEYFKGLALIPSNSNSAIVEYTAEDSKLILYFTKNGVNRFVEFSASSTRSYNNISPNINEPWMTGKLNGIQLYEPFDITGDELFLQSGTNLLLKLDLSGLRQFEDSLGSAIIQSAELRLGRNTVNSFLEPKSGISMGLTSLDSLENENYYIDPLVTNQNSNFLTFDNDIPGYKADIPLFIENLSSNDAEYDQVTFFLGGSNNTNATPSSSAVKKVIIDRNEIKLRIYYTIPDKNN